VTIVCIYYILIAVNTDQKFTQGCAVTQTVLDGLITYVRAANFPHSMCLPKNYENMAGNKVIAIKKGCDVSTGPQCMCKLKARAWTDEFPDAA